MTCKEKVDVAKKSETSSNITKINPGNSISMNTKDDANAIERNYDQKRKILIEETQKIKKVGEASKSQLEILELEMRARAIKAMLKAQDEHERQLKRRSCEAEVESHASHFDDRKLSRFRQNEHSDKGIATRTTCRRSTDKQPCNRSQASASFEGRSNYWEKRPDEEHAKRHWENHGHRREPDRYDDRRYNEWRDRYRDWWRTSDTFSVSQNSTNFVVVRVNHNVNFLNSKLKDCLVRVFVVVYLISDILFDIKISLNPVLTLK